MGTWCFLLKRLKKVVLKSWSIRCSCLWLVKRILDSFQGQIHFSDGRFSHQLFIVYSMRSPNTLCTNNHLWYFNSRFANALNTVIDWLECHIYIFFERTRDDLVIKKSRGLNSKLVSSIASQLSIFSSIFKHFISKSEILFVALVTSRTYCITAIACFSDTQIPNKQNTINFYTYSFDVH